MKKNFFRSGVAKTLVMGFFFAFFLLAANTTFAQAITKHAEGVLQQELVTLKAQMDAATPMISSTPQSPSEARLRYHFYSKAHTAVEKLGVTAGVQETYESFSTIAQKYPSGTLEQIRDDFLAILN